MRTSARSAAPRPTAGRRAGLGAVALFALVLLATAAAAESVDDLLFDLQLVPLDAQAPHEFTLPGLDGRPVSLAQFKGQVVLLYFWATW